MQPSLVNPRFVYDWGFQVHWKDEKTVREFHEFMQSMGYVVYHKETNAWGCKGECIEYGYLKLSTEFGSV